MPIARGAALAQAPHDVLDVENGVVDHDAKRDHEARQHHRVEGRAAPVEHEHRRQQRQRYGHDADQRRTQFVQKGENHDDDENAPKHQCAGKIVDGSADVFRGAKDLGVDLHVGKTGFHLLQRRFDGAGHLERVAPRVFLDDQHETGAVVDDRIADHSLRAPREFGHIAENELLSVALGDRHLSERFRGRARQDMMDGKAMLGGVDEAARADMGAAGIAQQPHLQRVRRRFHDMVEGQVELRQLAPDRPAPEASSAARPRSRHWRRRERASSRALIFQ